MSNTQLNAASGDYSAPFLVAQQTTPIPPSSCPTAQDIKDAKDFVKTGDLTQEDVNVLIR